MEAPALSQYTHSRLDRGAHVLVVEDDPVSLKFLCGVLACNDYRLTTVGTAREAMAALDRELPDLVILDLYLPDSYGLAVCKHLRQLLGGEDIPVLVVTIEDGQEGHAQAVRAGVDDFLRKPILPVELSTRARSLLRLRYLRRELRTDRESILDLHAQKESLLQYVAHDMKNLLGATQATLELMKEGCGPAQCTRYQDRLGDSLRAMLAMVKDLLDISIGDQVDLVADLNALEIGPWLEKVIQEFESLAARRRCSFRLAFPPGLVLEADPHLLRRVVSNLLENAIRYAPEGTAIEVEVQAGAGAQGPRIQVCDQGIGVPPELRSAIFDRFVRLKSPQETRSGRGLGLAFCRQVMAMHQGRIWVEDNVPKGSRFVLELPGETGR
ncbi:MAG: hybrid sensor histidine kinase/response regulator [Holophagaceae bacterium]|nr:hybrid sensor histidine kinase/response regulator [Holophagaceae bacterium]